MTPDLPMTVDPSLPIHHRQSIIANPSSPIHHCHQSLLVAVVVANL
jgi:hypothetical protein